MTILINYLFEHFSNCDGDYCTKIGIKVKKNDKNINSAIICSYGGSPLNNSTYVIENDAIIICCGNSIFSLKLPGLKLNWNVEVDESMIIGMKKMNNDYIIHGEQAISRVNKDGRIIWQKYGSDIFVTCDSHYFDINDESLVNDIIRLLEIKSKQNRKILPKNFKGCGRLDIGLTHQEITNIIFS
jgi:hypothetical protein